jgi:hypothetical protein
MNVFVESGIVVPIETTPVVDKYVAGVYKTGLTVKTKVRRFSDGFALDFSDMTFKTVGSIATILSGAFTEVDPTNFAGEYRFDFDLTTVANPTANDVYQFRVEEDGSAVAGNLPQIGQLRISKALDDAIRARKLLQNKQALAPGALGNLIVYDDDKITPLQTWNVTDSGGLAILLPAALPARRDPV